MIDYFLPSKHARRLAALGALLLALMLSATILPTNWRIWAIANVVGWLTFAFPIYWMLWIVLTLFVGNALKLRELALTWVLGSAAVLFYLLAFFGHSTDFSQIRGVEFFLVTIYFPFIFILGIFVDSPAILSQHWPAGMVGASAVWLELTVACAVAAGLWLGAVVLMKHALRAVPKHH